MNIWTYRVLWLVYLALLAVLLPHTAWAFGQYEPAGWHWLGWVGAVAFEGAIAALTWRLKQAIEHTANYRSLGKRWRARYVNPFSAGLLLAIGVSSAANWAHAVEFGTSFAVFADYSVSPFLYSLAFGGILPLCSLLFARILAETNDTEQEIDPAFTELNTRLTDARRQIRETEQRALMAEQRFNAVGDLVVRMFAEDKRERIVAIHERWPELPGRSVAIISETSPAYVSEILNENSR